MNARGPLSGFDADRASRLRARGVGYTRLVNALKILLPVAALAIAGIVFGRLTSSPLQQVADIPKEEKTTPGQVEVVKAQYEGTDDAGRAYTLIAGKASRATDAPDTVLMEQVQADIFLDNGNWLAVKAQQGRYDISQQKLRLSGGVDAFHDSGYEMHLRGADIDMKTRQAQTAEPVRAQGPLGEITAAGMTVTQQGNKIVFTGPAKIVFNDLGTQG
jgi:lipopolysaccharide export system protein LptC